MALDSAGGLPYKPSRLRTCTGPLVDGDTVAVTCSESALRTCADRLEDVRYALGYVEVFAGWWIVAELTNSNSHKEGSYIHHLAKSLTVEIWSDRKHTRTPTMKTKEQVIKILDLKIAALQEQIDLFVIDLKKDAADSFAWADGDFETAARLDVYRRIHRSLTGEGTLETIREYAHKQVMHAAMCPKYSTSPCSNFMSQLVAAEWARVLDPIGGILGEIK